MGGGLQNGRMLMTSQALPLKKGWAEMFLAMLNRGGGGAQNGSFNV